MFKILSKPQNSFTKFNISYFNGRYLNKTNARKFSVSKNTPRGSSKSYTYNENDVIHGFKITKIEDIPDFSIKSYSLEHEQTKARYLHLHSPDQNNTFSAIFRTIPTNDKGIPHILEHLVLCGSEKFPVRDPFMNMLKRSLNTYMNAWTGGDYTAYPFSTQNEKDFYNLLSVYTDVVFKPMLNYHDFMQEGWRYDFNQENNQNALGFKGVVFNEMKGVYQMPDNLFEESIEKHIFANTPYKLSSGGRPKNIVELSYEELKEFYNRFYHPSNAAFFSYGDLDFTKMLKYLHETYLSKYQYSKINSEMPSQPRFNQSIEAKVQSPPDAVSIDPTKQAKFAVSFLCNDTIKDPFDTVALNILSYLFFETPNSPFYKAFLESGIAEGYCPGYGYNSTTKEGIFTIGVKGVSEDTKELAKIEEVINKTLHEVVEKGFDSEFIDSVLHQVEVQAKLPKSDFGINILQGLMVLLNHKGDPTFMLKVSDNLARLKNLIKEGKFFENLVKKYLIDNKHNVKITMTPDEEYILKDLEEEKNTLERIQQSLTDKDKEKIIKDNEALNKRQEEVIDPNILPTLEIEDIPKISEHTTFENVRIMDIPVSFIEQPTNGLTFLRLKFNIKDAPIFIRPYIRMFCEFFPKLGTKMTKHGKMSQLLDLYTVNFSVTHDSFSIPINVEESEEYIIVQIGCLDKNVENMFKLITELFISADYADYANLSKLVKIHSSEAANSFVENSLDYAINYAASGYRESIQRSNVLESSRFLCNFGSNFLRTGHVKEYLEEINFHFSGISNYILTKDIISFAVHSNKSMFDQVQKRIEDMLNTIKGERSGFLIPSSDKNTSNIEDEEGNLPVQFSANHHKSHFVLPMQVNYVVESVPIPHFTHPDTPTLHLLCELISSTVLHREIREKGGAYGGGSMMNSNNGAFNFYSYRDPNALETYEAFKKSIDWATNGEMTSQDIKDAKLSLFSKVDKIIEPQNKGLRYWIYGINDSMRDEYRRKLLEAKKDDLVEVAKKYIYDKMQKGQTSKVIFGSQNNDLELLKSKGWKIEKPVEELFPEENS